MTAEVTCPLSGSQSALPSRPGCAAYSTLHWARTTCHVTYLPDQDAIRPGPPTSSRHYGVGFDTVEATIRVTEPLPYRRALGRSRSRRTRTEGAGADDFESTPTTLVIPVTWPPPCRGTLMVPTVTARLKWKDKADRARNVPYRNLAVTAGSTSEIFNG